MNQLDFVLDFTDLETSKKVNTISDLSKKSFPNQEIAILERKYQQTISQIDEISYYQSIVDPLYLNYMGHLSGKKAAIEYKIDSVARYIFYRLDSLKIYQLIWHHQLFNKSSKVSIVTDDILLVEPICFYEVYTLLGEKSKHIELYLNKSIGDIEKKHLKMFSGYVKNITNFNKTFQDVALNQDLIVVDCDDKNEEIQKINFLVGRLKSKGSMLIRIGNIKDAKLFNQIGKLRSQFNKVEIHKSILFDAMFILLREKQVSKEFTIDFNLAYHTYYKIFESIYLEKMMQIIHIQELILNPSKIESAIAENRNYTWSYLKKINIKTIEWDDKRERSLCKDYITRIRNVLYLNDSPVIYNLNTDMDYTKQPIIGSFEDVLYPTPGQLKQILSINESYYQYTEKVNDINTKNNNLKIVVNYHQKKLQHLLHKVYNFSINGKNVSRAWVKMYELCSRTNYFDNLIEDTKNKKSSEIRGFHVCEAPGNFINSISCFLERRQYKYKWNAQSLRMGDIFDEYGFIKKTEDQWDFGPSRTGNITSHENLKYYYQKYKGIDSMIGDCGGNEWNSDLDECKNLASYQMIYSLLLPRIGGNFIIKTYAVNFNLQFLSLLVLAGYKYEKLLLFKSSRNSWSGEIYIIGINKKELTQKEIDSLFKLSKDNDSGKFNSIVKNIPTDFSARYEYIIYGIMKKSIDISKYFHYYRITESLQNNKKERNNLIKYIDRKNMLWLSKNLPELENTQSKYRDLIYGYANTNTNTKKK